MTKDLSLQFSELEKNIIAELNPESDSFANLQMTLFRISDAKAFYAKALETSPVQPVETPTAEVQTPPTTTVDSGETQPVETPTIN